jgi:hypothetical protein
VEEKFARGFGLMIEEVAMAVFVDVGVKEPDFPVVNPCEGIPDLPLAGPQRFHLGSFEDDPGFKGLQDMIIPAGFGVGHDVAHKNANSQKAVLLAG